MRRRLNSSQNSTTRAASGAAPDITSTVTQTQTDANRIGPPAAPLIELTMKPFAISLIAANCFHLPGTRHYLIVT